MYVVLLILILQVHVSCSLDYYDMAYSADEKENNEPSFAQKLMDKYSDKVQEYGIGFMKYLAESAFGKLPLSSDSYYAKLLKSGWDRHGHKIIIPMKHVANSVYSRLFPNYGQLFNIDRQEQELEQDLEQDLEQAQELEQEQTPEKKLTRKSFIAFDRVKPNPEQDVDTMIDNLDDVDEYDRDLLKLLNSINDLKDEMYRKNASDKWLNFLAIIARVLKKIENSLFKNGSGEEFDEGSVDSVFGSMYDSIVNVFDYIKKPKTSWFGKIKRIAHGALSKIPKKFPSGIKNFFSRRN